MSDKTIFISYSHDSEEHCLRVASLAQRLNDEGIEVLLDRYHDKGDPPQGWQRWMMDCLDKADHVLVICTATYYRRFRGHEIPGKGLGANWEGALITAELYQSGSNGHKFIPVLFHAADTVHIVEPLLSRNYYLLDSKENYQALYNALLGQAGIDPGPLGTLKRQARQTVAPLSFGDTEKSPAIPPDISRILKYAPAHLLGREAELAQLDAAWNKAVNVENHRPRILSFVALGGEGKTSLVAKWAAGLAKENWPGCEAAFAWSFYSQGSKDQSAASGDLFLREALRFFGDPAMAESPAGLHEKGQRLAHLVGERRALLILDGLEPLQFAPTSPTPGVLKDQGLAALLKGLAINNAGLCLITTRYPIGDLKAFGDGAVTEVELKRLTQDTGVALLKELGVNGSREEMGKLVEDVRGHALTLTIMGRFLQRTYKGDVRKRDLFKLGDAAELGGNDFLTVASYASWLDEDDDKGRCALAILSLVSLYDRPADAGSFSTLLRAPLISGLTDALFTVKNEYFGLKKTYQPLEANQLNILYHRLETAYLLAINRDANGCVISLDAPPLLREYFAARLRKSYPDAWRAAHRRIYEYLYSTTKEGDQPSLEALQPLYHAVMHGCCAGIHEEARARVYRDRISRGGKTYGTKEFGAYSKGLMALACFFEEPWRRLAPKFNANAEAWLLHEAAYHLRALGRLTEAREPMQAALNLYANKKDFKSAAINAGNLSDLEVTIGDLNKARVNAKLAIKYADDSREVFQRWSKRATYAGILQQAGDYDEANIQFREAEKIQASHHHEYPFLPNVWGFRYCEQLLAPVEYIAWHGFSPSTTRRPGERGGAWDDDDLKALPFSPPFAKGRQNPLIICTAVTQRATQTLKWANQNKAGLLPIALDHLTLGRAAFYAALLGGTSPDATYRTDLEAAVTGLRRAGDTTYLPHGLLTRAWLRAFEGCHSGAESAQADLDEAWEIAERGPMPLFLADIHLHRARLFGKRDAYPWDSPQADLKAARKLIEKHGYGRRKEELEDAERAFGIS